MAKPTGKLNTRVAINNIKLDSLPLFVYSGSNDIIPWGIDNLYPHRILTAIKKSPTALGCIKRQSEFIFGNGDISGAGEIVVNRNGETLNDIIWQCIRHGYSTLYGYGLHFNFNALGQISEIFFVNAEYIRKKRNLKEVEYGVFRADYGVFLQQNNIIVDLYDIATVREKFHHDYNGQIEYYSKDSEIYPTSPIDSAIISASYEMEAQIYPYANIKNGFSGNTIIKYPSLSQGEDADKEANKIQEDIRKLHGSENAGSSLVISVPTNANGEMGNAKIVEHLSPTNVDTLFVNQNAKAENDILKVYNMPKILLGISSDGMFNEASFNDAFNYKNSDTETDRKAIERHFNKFLKYSIFGIDKINLTPLNLRQGVATGALAGVEKPSGGAPSEINQKQLEAQASLKGSVGGVQGILAIQAQVKQGITEYEAGLAILELIYGINEAEGRRILGNKQELETP